MTSADAPPQRGSRREVFAWALYDWANSAYSALSITILVYYIKAVVAPGRQGDLIWAWGISASMLVAAFLSPVIGAIADANASKRRWLAATALPGAMLATAMVFVPPEYTWVITAMFVSFALCFELSLGVYNGFLPEIADDESMNRVSAYGYALGYVGGGIALAIAVVILGFGQHLGLPDGTALTRDYHATADGEFAVAVPGGTYDVRLTLGDPARAHDQMAIYLQGAKVAVVSTQPGEHVERTFPVEVTDGRVRLRLVDEGGDDPQAVVNGVSVISHDPALVVPPLDFGTPGSAADDDHIWVAATDRFAERKTADRFTPPPPPQDAQGATDADGATADDDWPSEIPRRISFGWTAGEVRGVDAVLPLRLRIGILIMGLWWGIFTVPTLVILRDRPKPQAARAPMVQATAAAFRQVINTLRHVRRFPMLAFFLLGFLIYNDGIQTVITQASVFAIEALRMPADQLILVVLMIQFLALPGAWIIGRLSDVIGQKPALSLCLAVWIGLLVAAFFVTTSVQFWIMGAVLAMVMGGTQSVSRAIMAVMTPADRTAEFFGFFNLSGKATSFVGPFVFGLVLYLTDTAHLAILSLLVFFVLGWLCIIPVKVARGRQQARQA